VSCDESFFAHVADAARFRDAIRRFDELNAGDPNHEFVDGVPQPRELVNARRVCAWVMTLAPNASEELRLAARSQHICRWQIPRHRYEMTRAGYHHWRNDLKRFHAEKSSAVLMDVGYSQDVASRVRDLNLKKNFPADGDSRILEDALCLVFLQFQLAELANKTDEAKVINALQKSWNKMTPAAREHAPKLDFAPRERDLLQRALCATSSKPG
jgi:hypothetical protein